MILFFLAVLAALLIAAVAMLAVLLSRQRRHAAERDGAFHLQRELSDAREKRADDRALASDAQLSAFRQSSQDASETLRRSVQEAFMQQELRFRSFAADSAQSLRDTRETVQRQLTDIRSDSGKKLDEMRSIVDEKLQKTLSDRMTESFRLVNERLEQVYKGLGEMQTLAQGVGDLKKVLSNVKTRGTLGEVQLGAILGDILTKDQYDVNVETKKDSGCRVEFAVRLPAEDGSFVYLPIDSKFPGDTYANLRDAYERSDQAQIDLCAKTLVATIRQEAKDIRQKYVYPPFTTEFAVLFLPFEGLYAEAVNRGLVETLQREFRVNIAGPSTMAALLNSLQMSFRSIAIQKRSGEVWRVLENVHGEVDKFAAALEATQKHIKQADDDLDKLVGTRTRAIQRTLRDVKSIASDGALTTADEE